MTGKVECHVAFVPDSEVVDDVRRPLVGLGEQHPVRVSLVDLPAHPLEVGVRLEEVLAVGPLALEQVRHGIQPEPIEAEVEPEAQHVEHRLLDLWVVVVEVGLVVEEPMPVVRARLLVPRPVRRLRVDEDDTGVLVPVLRVGPHVPVALGVVRRRACRLEPGVVDRRVVHDQIGHDAHAALVRCVDQRLQVVHRPVVRMYAEEVGDVVAAVAHRGRVDGKQPDAVDPEPLEVVQLVDDAADVAVAVAVGVVEAADVDLVEHRRPEPKRLRLEPAMPGGVGHGRTAST